MKRYKVVQDARGHWGIWDTEADDFAPWGSPGYTGADMHKYIIHYAINLNEYREDRHFYVWDGEYLPREEA